MGALHSVPKVGFEDIMDTVLKNKHAYMLLNTLSPTDQDCLIVDTVSAHAEESIMNQLVSTNKAHYIIVYGRNANDPSLVKKYEQLTKIDWVCRLPAPLISMSGNLRRHANVPPHCLGSQSLNQVTSPMRLQRF